MKVVALAGGVGAGKFLRGLIRAIPAEDVTVVVNTADDLRIHGLLVCPDIDSVTYWLSGLADRERGWGRAGDSFRALVANALDLVASSARHPVLLEVKVQMLPVRGERLDARGHGVLGHREHPCFDAEASSDARGRLRETLAGRQQVSTGQMGAEVQVPE